ncbi:MAG: hypothetical protein H0W33_12085 [Gammaproteobacteria bacterium]|nr:hypothetical protein [Gammaproteobacteria bacterium]
MRTDVTTTRTAGAHQTLDLLLVDEALARLAVFDPRQSRIVELRFFGGLDIEETAEALGISSPTVKRDWTLAKAWLHRELNSDPGVEPPHDS